MSDEAQACEVPLLERLQQVPAEAHEWREDSQGWQNIPYGSLCKRAADALEQAQKIIASQRIVHEQEAERITRLEAELKKAKYSATRMKLNHRP